MKTVFDFEFMSFSYLYNDCIKRARLSIDDCLMRVIRSDLDELYSLGMPVTDEMKFYCIFKSCAKCCRLLESLSYGMTSI